MTRLARACLVLASVGALAACPKKQPDTTPAQPQGAGCPGAAGVYVASFVTQEQGKGRTGWVLPLHAVAVQPGASVADYATIDAAAASAAGVPAAPTGTIWLATSSGEPCRASVGSYYAAKIDGPPPSISYGVELDGCPAPGNPDEGGGIALVSEEAPTGCRFEVAQPAAARLGEMDANKQWQRPAKETPIPTPLATAIPQKPCAAPDCEMLWAFGEVRVAGRTVAWTGAVNWLTVGDPAAQCSWPVDRFSGIFVPTQTGATKIDEGQEHPLVLSAVLADASGARVVLAEGPGAYATYDLVPGGATLARRATWMLAPDEAWQTIDHIGPICEPGAAKPN